MTLVVMRSELTLLALLALVGTSLYGCGGGGGDTPSPTPTPGTPTPPPTTATTTTTKVPYHIDGECSDAQRKTGCASGFCNNDSTCECLANYMEEKDENGATACAKPGQQNAITFYMYRAQDDHDYKDWSNDDLASLSGAVWYLHNEVVVQSCPRKFDITRVIRLKVTMRNTDKLYPERKSMFGPFAIFDSGACHTCEDDYYNKLGYVVGCQTPGASDKYTYNGYPPIWYSLPGECPSEAFVNKTFFCKVKHAGGQCSLKRKPDGSSCTFTYEEAGSVGIAELYGNNFDYPAYCAEGTDVREYDPATDKGNHGMDFWNGKDDVVANAKRVEVLRTFFKKKYPKMPELPEPWCDWQDPAGPTADADEMAFQV